MPRNSLRRTDFSTSGPPKRSPPQRPHRATSPCTVCTRPQQAIPSGSAGGSRFRRRGVGPMTNRATCSSGAPWHQRRSARRRCRARLRREAHRVQRAAQLPTPRETPQLTHRHSARQRVRHRFAGVPRVWAAMDSGSLCRTVSLSLVFPVRIKTIAAHTVGYAPRRRQAATAIYEENVTLSVNRCLTGQPVSAMVAAQLFFSALEPGGEFTATPVSTRSRLRGHSQRQGAGQGKTKSQPARRCPRQGTRAAGIRLLALASEEPRPHRKP